MTHNQKTFIMVMLRSRLIMRIFIITAQSPYLSKVTNASASTNGICLLKMRQIITIHKKSEAIGLSGINGKKYQGVLANRSPYQINPYKVPSMLQISKKIKQECRYKVNSHICFNVSM